MHAPEKVGAVDITGVGSGRPPSHSFGGRRLGVADQSGRRRYFAMAIQDYAVTATGSVDELRTVTRCQPEAGHSGTDHKAMLELDSDVDLFEDLSEVLDLLRRTQTAHGKIKIVLFCCLSIIWKYEIFIRLGKLSLLFEGLA